MQFTEDMMRAALEGTYTYIATDVRRLQNKPEDKAEVVTQTRADVSPTITYKRVARQYQKLLEAVARVHDIEPDLLASSSRTKRVALARAHLMYEMRHRTTLSLPQIGKAMGVDHTTVLYNIRKFEVALPEHHDKVWKLKHVLNEA